MHRLKVKHIIALSIIIACVLFSAGIRAQYLPLKPAFVVNLNSQDEVKFVQVIAQVQVSTDEAANALEHHQPAIRDALLMLLSNNTEQQIRSRQGKEELRSEALEIIRKVLEQQHVKLEFAPADESEPAKEGEAAATPEPLPPIQAVYFTGFIVQ